MQLHIFEVAQRPNALRRIRVIGKLLDIPDGERTAAFSGPSSSLAVFFLYVPRIASCAGSAASEAEASRSRSAFLDQVVAVFEGPFVAVVSQFLDIGEGGFWR